MTAIKVPYLGAVGNLLRLPSPNGVLPVASSRGESVKGLASGGTSVFSRLNERRTYSLPYSYLPSADADLLRGFYLNQFGLGPFVFVDPTIRNVLSVDVASCGVRSQAAIGWVPSAGTLARDVGSPVPGSGVLTWTGITAGASLRPAVSPLASPACLPPLEPVTVSLWVKTSSSGASLTLQMTGYDSTGTTVTGSLTQTATVGTTWTPMTVTAPATSPDMAPCALVVPRLFAPGSAVPTSISIAAAQVEYGDARTAWQLGHGAPRVLITGSPGREVQQTATFASDHTFTLAEI